MEIGVASPIGMEQRPSLLVHCRIVCFEAQVEAQEKICEIQSQTDTVGRSYFFVEAIESEHAARLARIVADGPYVAGIDEQGTFEHPEQPCAVLHTQVEPYVAALVYEVGYRVFGIVCSRTESTHSPAAYSVGATGIKAFFEGNHTGVAVRISYACSDMEGQCIAAIEIAGVCIVGLAFYVLGILYAEILYTPS